MIPRINIEEWNMQALEAAGDRAQTAREEAAKFAARAAMEAPRASGGGYENAPATRMLATHCCACGRPLVDAKSVEIGMGPDCRKKYGYDAAMGPATEEVRREANRIVYEVAAHQNETGPKAGMEQAARVERLFQLGLVVLAQRVLERLAPVVIEEEGGRLAVKTPYSEEATLLFRGIPGRRWDGERKVNVVPVGERRTLWWALQRAFPGMLARGPKGVFVLGGAS